MGAEEEAAARQALQAPAGGAAPKKDKGALCEWRARAPAEGETEGGGLELVQQFPVTHVAWHARGDYFASVAPTGNTQVGFCLSRRVAVSQEVHAVACCARAGYRRMFTGGDLMGCSAVMSATALW